MAAWVLRGRSIVIAILLTVSPAYAQPATDAVAKAIHQQLDSGASERAHWSLDWSRLKEFYRSRDWQPVWTGGSEAYERAALWRDTLRKADTEGLDPRDYHLAVIEEYWSLDDAASEATLDLLLTDAFIHYSADVRIGRLNPAEVDPDWHIALPSAKHVPYSWLTLGPKDFASLLRTLPPPQAGYWRLREGLARYRKLENDGGWPALPPGPALQYGDHSHRVGLLRIRLADAGDLVYRGTGDANEFDGDVREAVKHFQKRYGFKDDGVVGPETRAAMNVPVAARIEQIRLNMERWRWLPRKLGDRYVMINTAGYRLEAVEEDHAVLAMRVITGQKDWMTPVLAGDLVSIQFNPYWLVPQKIAAEELLPKQQKNPHYFSAEKIRVFDNWAVDPKELDPSRIDWSKLTKDNFPYRLRQDPGPWNALGRVKFILTNDFAIYLHDTPHRRLFAQESRALSHGCVRVEHPVELASYLVRDESGWNRQRILQVIDSEETEAVRLSRPIPIYLVYWTAWVDDSDQVNFRPDIYERDRLMEEEDENTTKSG